MQRTMKSNLISRILCMMLIVAMALFTAGCKADEKETPQSGQETNVTITAAPQEDVSGEGAEEAGDAEDSEPAGDAADGVTGLGEGAVSFNLLVTDREGVETKFVIHTDETTVGAALLGLGLIEGKEDTYGLYVKKVNGITADYDVDKTYWAFYINGEYAMSGVDATKIAEGESYMFKVEK